MVKQFDLFYNRNASETLYYNTDGHGGYNLTNDDSVFCSYSEQPFTNKFGIPDSQIMEYDVLDVEGILGIYDSNMDIVYEFESMEELTKEIDDVIEEMGITLFNWES